MKIDKNKSYLTGKIHYIAQVSFLTDMTESQIFQLDGVPCYIVCKKKNRFSLMTALKDWSAKTILKEMKTRLYKGRPNNLRGTLEKNCRTLLIK